MGLLIGGIVCVVIMLFLLVICCGVMVKDSLPNITLPSVGDIPFMTRSSHSKVVPVAQASAPNWKVVPVSEASAPDSEESRKISATEPSNQPSNNNAGRGDDSGDGPETQGSFRRLQTSDLRPELIPGLRLRVLWPQAGPGRRWYPATATGYTTGSQEMVTLEWDKASLRRTQSLRIGDGLVRLHEDALTQVAKQRILAKAVEKSIFQNSNFPSLDTNGDGFIEESELQAGLSKTGINLDFNSARALLQLLDKDGNGKINSEEFRKFLMKSR
eukprot:TRINITY_DN8524_c0_g1_i1.p1 TRINITY_DN8524_c0_g1~~TRINITY_DN8524_c0_g1_i1.p1  ORF type:complete len:272 (-),score=30.98 TRINITY_DN8524_c0_g1_i1:294-1109(-)